MKLGRYMRLVTCAGAIAAALTLSNAAHGADKPVEVTLDATKPGAVIDRHIFGQFAEHLGTGIYEGIWVGKNSTIPNTRGIRKDVVAALKALKVPNVRWPGGCFADRYNWRRGIGPERTPAVGEPNTFGTDEFMDFADQIGTEAYSSRCDLRGVWRGRIRFVRIGVVVIVELFLLFCVILVVKLFVVFQYRPLSQLQPKSVARGLRWHDQHRYGIS